MRYLGLVILNCVLCVFSNSSAQSIEMKINPSFRKGPFPALLQSITDTSFKLSSTQVAQQMDIVLNTKTERKVNFGYSYAAFWLGTQIVNTGTAPRLITVSLENPNIDSVEFWINKGYSYILAGRAGDHLPHKKWIEASRQPSFTFSIDSGQSVGLLIRARNSFSGNMILPIRIWDANHFDLYQQGYHLAWGLYFGFLLINIALAFSAIVLLRNGLYVWYAFFLLSSLSYTFFSFGFMYQYFTGDWYGSNDQLRTTSVILLSLFMMRFSQQFLRFKRHQIRLHHTISAIMLVQVLLLVSSLFILEFLRKHFNSIFPWFLTLMLIGYVLLLVGSFLVRKDEPLRAKAFILAYGLSLIGGGVLILTDLNVLPYNTYTIHAAWFGNSIEILIFTGILFYELKLVGDQKEKLEQQIADAQQQRLKEFFRGQEKERERIARDLHDHVAGTLVGARFLMPHPNRMEKLLDEKTFVGYSRAIHALDRSIKDVRNLSHDLQPPSLNGISLKFELQRLMADYKVMQPEVQYYLAYDLDGPLLNDDLAVAIYRICQECLQNAFKHAKANFVGINLSNQSTRVTLIIEDDGVGFDTSERATGIGLQNIKSRLAFAPNLYSVIYSQPGKGTRIELSFDCA